MKPCHFLILAFLPFFLLNAAPLAEEKNSFAPALLRTEWDRQFVEPGEEIQATFTMANLGARGSLFPLRLHLEANLQGAEKPSKLVAQGESFPPTTLWRKDQTATFGFALSVPAQAVPGTYEVVAFLRPKDGGPVVPWKTSDGNPQETIPLGLITVLAAGQTPKAQSPWIKDFAQPPTSTEPPVTGTDSPPVRILATPEIEIALDASQPRILRAGRDKAASLGSESPTGLPVFQIFRKSDGEWFSSASSPQIKITYQTESDAARVSYHATIFCDNQPAAECTLFFTLAGDELRVGFENVRPAENFLLATITWPRILSAHTPETRLVNGRFSGRLIDPAKCIPGTVTHESTWIDPFVGGVLHTSRVLATVGIDSPGDLVTSFVGREGRKPSAGFGLEFTHYIADRGHPWKTWILAAGSSMARLRFIERKSSEAPLTWVDGAKLLREAVTDVKPPSIYQDSVIYKILLDSKDYKDIPPELPATSFAQAREIMRQISVLGDGIRQIAYLTGAQHEGQDTKYPDVFTTNSKLGTRDDLIALIRDGRNSNAVVSFHSCATEAYKDSPMWNEDIIARDPSGALFVYNRFAGGDCYWINQDQFARRGMGDLITRIFSTYPITETYHIDVLSTRAANVDFNPANPCPPNAGYAGRLRMVDEFNSHGIDLTSEGLISWFIGKIGHAWLLKCEPLTYLLGEEPVPFAPMIYHGHATYGLPSELNPLQGMLYGATFSMDFMPFDRMKFYWPGNSLADSLYLQNFPFQMLREREMQGYTRNGNLRRVTYDEDTYVEIEVPDAALRAFRGYREGEMGRFRIVVDGKTVARDFTAFFPGRKPGSYLAYSRRGGEVEYDAPIGWGEESKLVIEPLEGTPAKASATVKDGQIALNLPAGIPVRITRKE